MGRAHRLSSSAWARAGACLAVAAIAFVCQAIASFAQAPTIRGRDCFRDRWPADFYSFEDDLGAANAARACWSEASSRPRQGLPNAYYAAAKGERVLGVRELENGNTEAGRRHLEEAARLFGLVVNHNDTATPSRRAILDDAQLELVRTNRLLRRYNYARRLLDDLLDGDQYGAARRALLFERAMLEIDQLDPDGEDTAGRRATMQSALRDLSVFSSRDDSQAPDRYVLFRGPMELSRLAMDLGDAAMEGPPTQENTQEAVRLYSDAVRANEVLAQLGRGSDSNVGRTQVRLGMLYLRLAGLLGRANNASFECGAGADPGQLDGALRAFTDARRLDSTSADANWGLGCVAMARANTLAARGPSNNAAAAANYREAIDFFSEAVRRAQPGADLANPRSEYSLGLARALAALSLLYGDSRWPEALTRYDEARIEAEREGNMERVGRIYLEMARVQQEHGRPNDALISLGNAIARLPDGNAEAYLRRGEILRESGNVGAAREDLQRATAIQGPHQARAFFILSQLEMADAREGTAGAQRAIDAADAALRLDGENDQYRRQGCVVRLMFHATADNGRFYCSAGAGSSSEALFYEGLYWLNEAYRMRSDEARRNNWAEAIVYFERGMEGAGTEQLTVSGQSYSLRRLLTYGRRFALHCAGLGRANATAPGDPASDPERTLFAQYGLPRCWR